MATQISNGVKQENKIGTNYEFCSGCSKCPVAVEAKIGKESGLEIRDDYNGSVRLTDQNLQDLVKFLKGRLDR